jgi:putative flippase GtrA
MGFHRWLVFNGVGIVGFAVQLGVLAVLLHLRLHYLAATALAVEVTVLHNFAWHERWTWKDRPADCAARWERLWRFHALNGAVSLGGNLILMRALVGGLGMAPVPANLVAVLACALLNYTASDRMVFRIT